MCELLGEIVVWKEAAGVSLRDLRRIVGQTVVRLKSIFVSQEVEQQAQLVSHEGSVVVLVFEERAELSGEGQRRIAHARQVALGTEAAARVEEQCQNGHADRNPQRQAQRWPLDEEGERGVVVILLRIVGLIFVSGIDEAHRAVVEIGLEGTRQSAPLRHGEPVVGEHCAAGDPRDRAARGKLVAQAVDVPIFVAEHHADGLRSVGRDALLQSLCCAFKLQRRHRDENVLRSRLPVAESQRVVGFLGVQGDEWSADHAVEHRFPTALFAHVDLFVVVDERKRQEGLFPLGDVLCIVEIKLPVPSVKIVCQSEKGVVYVRSDVCGVDNASAVAGQASHALQLFQIVLLCVIG